MEFVYKFIGALLVEILSWIVKGGLTNVAVDSISNADLRKRLIARIRTNRMPN